jgi:uncharacterized protein (TIGR03435 family)
MDASPPDLPSQVRRLATELVNPKPMRRGSLSEYARLVSLLTITLLAICSITALSGADQTKFEVASVKRTNACEFNTSIDSAVLTLNGVPLKVVLMQAFSVKMDQIEGPSWLDADCFAISAKIPEGATRDQVPAMLQALLTERLKLAAHKEERQRSGYALVVDKGGPKFKEDDPKTSFMGKGPQGSTRFGFAGHGQLKGVMTMATLAVNLSKRGYGPVQDLTGLAGKYDIELSWATDPAFEPRGLGAAAAPTPQGAASPAEPEANLFAALRESLGLKLERRNVSVETVVIDHIERVPTEN